jgi:hypothetical protein
VQVNAELPFFPLTPIELKAGVVIGVERILTNRSGRFGWGDDSAADVYLFDALARRVAEPDAKTLRRWGKTMTELRLPPDHLAVLVRRPR